jgi:hypothetical protein
LSSVPCNFSIAQGNSYSVLAKTHDPKSQGRDWRIAIPKRRFSANEKHLRAPQQIRPPRSVWGHFLRLPHRNIAGRFTSISRH